MKMRIVFLVFTLGFLTALHGLVGFHVGYMLPQHHFDNAYDDVFSAGMEVRNWGENGYGTEICIDYIFAENSKYRDENFGVIDYEYRLIPLTTTILVRSYLGGSFVYSGMGSGYYFQREHAVWKGGNSEGSSTATSNTIGFHFVLGFQTSILRVQAKYMFTRFYYNENVHYWNDAENIDIAGLQITAGLAF